MGTEGGEMEMEGGRRFEVAVIAPIATFVC